MKHIYSLVRFVHVAMQISRNLSLLLSFIRKDFFAVDFKATWIAKYTRYVPTTTIELLPEASHYI